MLRPLSLLSLLAVCAVSASPLGAAVERVDILVVYTPAARAYAGSPNAMKAAINSYIAATNTAYSNSDINVVLKLVGTAEVTYTENSDMGTDLARLRSSTDAFLPTVPALRETYQADLVALIRRSDAAGVAGIAYLGNLTSGFAPNAYSVVADIWAVGNQTFPHETGHNFGCQHDHANAGAGVRPYAYGHRFTGTNKIQYRSIMAYAPGTRIAHFSNPSINYQGTATGVSGTGVTAADNARLIEESAVVTRTFRDGGRRLGNAVVGDLDNSGSADLLLTDEATGERVFWAMSGASRTSSSTIATVAPAWRLAAAADFNADGKTDLVWEHTGTGDRSIWLMNGIVRTQTVSLGNIGKEWSIGVAGDFNADGKPDLVWQNSSSGACSIWIMNGTTRTSSMSLGTLPVAWRVVAAGDFNGDAKTDLVWHNTDSGQVSIWLMDGGVRSSSVLLGTLPTAWRIAGAADLNSDGDTDLIWEHASSRARTVWYMSDTTRLSTAPLTAAEL